MKKTIRQKLLWKIKRGIYNNENVNQKVWGVTKALFECFPYLNDKKTKINELNFQLSKLQNKNKNKNKTIQESTEGNSDESREKNQNNNGMGKEI